jgi:cell division septation protein DedD
MRAFALLLAAVNILYFGWAAWIDAPPPMTSGSAVEDVPGLMLARERTAPIAGTSTQAVARSERPTESSASGPSCTSVGPFQDLASAAQAAAALKGAGFDSEQRLEQGEMWVGYWLSLQGLGTRDEADRALARLKEQGISDAYIIPGSDPANVVSLGVFKDHERAQRRLSEIQQLGLPAQLSDRKRAGSVYWLDAAVNPGQALDLSLLGSEPGKILRLEMRACP